MFADRCRLRRSGVALQHVSAHFAVAKGTIDFIFQFLLPDRHQINFYWSCQKGKEFFPLPQQAKPVGAEKDMDWAVG
jgi:hypothetical protein